ncbi:hypothetical protein PV04_00935 [Phialophora macrospora]|uniref:CHAT domain-containing protein n=1 Tax=Phialophora macrospora TaxID=1851006 RepID=A0A0D2G1T4_9EURO|nr:hypothetical protein PV04_00935 [Phialophora macrospora]
MELEEVNQIVAQSILLQELGDYAAATTLLTERWTARAHPSLQVLSELGKSLQSQGYFGRALKVLRDGVAGLSPLSNEKQLDSVLRLQLEMQICVLEPLVEGHFGSSLARSSRLYQDYCQLLKSDLHCSPSAYLETSRAKLLLLANDYHKPQQLETFQSILDRFEQLFSSLLEGAQYADAFLLARTFNSILTSKVGRSLRAAITTHPNRLLELLRSDPHVPGLIRAKALQTMVTYKTDLHGASYPDEAIAKFENEAIGLFKAGGHKFGAITMTLQQECRNIKRKDEDLDETLKRILANFEELEAVDNILELQAAIRTFAEAVAPFHNLDLDLNLSNRALEVAERSGDYLIRCQGSVSTLGRWLVTSGRAPTVIESGETVYNSLGETDAFFLKGLLAQILAQAYMQLEEFDKSLSWADQCALAWSHCHALDRAQAASEQLRAKLHRLTPLDKIDQIIEAAQQQINEEEEAGFVGPAIDKLHWLFVFMMPRRDPRVESTLQHLERLLERLPTDNAAAQEIQQANLLQNMSNKLLADAATRPDTVVEEQCEGLLEKAVQLYQKHGNTVCAANTRQLHALVMWSKFKKSGTREILDQASELFSISLDAFRVLGVSSMSVSAAYWCSFVLFEAWARGWADHQTVLAALSGAEEERATMRTDTSIFGGSQAIALKQRFAGDGKVMDIYHRAIKICLTHQLFEELWSWIQRGKARSVSDLLGLDTVTPSSIKSRIVADPATKELFEKELDLITDLQRPDNARRANVRGDLHILRSQMRAYPDLQNLMDLREGKPRGLSQMHELAASPQLRKYGSVIFADWFMFNGRIFVCTVKDQESPMVWSCNLSRQAVEDWKARWIDGTDGLYQDELDEDDDECCLRELDGLVDFVPLVSKAGDLIVCSASGALHSIPLHALWIKQEPLIVRNFVIYCASLTTFAQCFQRAAETEPKTGSRTVFAAYEDGPETLFSEQEQERIYSSVQVLGSSLNADVYFGPSAQRSHFQQAIQRSALFHFHGHCRLDKADVSDQALVLPDGSMTVKDLFGLQLHQPHITLIACSSSTQGISAGDEPLGLVTALLCAGASSVLGTLWPTHSSTGRAFSKVFYEKVKECHGDNLNVVDLAAALRAAALDLRADRRTRKPADWAAFVLHGSCFRTN